MSLRINELAPELIAKVRAAAAAKLKTSLRLRERVRHRIGAAPRLRGPNVRKKAAATGDGLVLVGTSTGGPPALEQLLTGLPASFPWPMLIAQHMPASFTGQLARRLDGLCSLTVREVSEPVPLQPGFAYIGRGDADLIVSRRGAGLVAMAAPSQAGYPWHPSTDRLVRSALNYIAPSQLVGVLMTGMGNDGAEAMALLHAQGGRVIAEAEETAVVWGMPGELVKMNGADYVLPLPDIAENLLKLVPRAADPKLINKVAASSGKALRISNAISRKVRVTSVGTRHGPPLHLPDGLRALAPRDIDGTRPACPGGHFDEPCADRHAANAPKQCCPDLRSDDSQLRAAALDALRAMPAATRDHLPQLLHDADPDVRLLACDLVRGQPAAEAGRLLGEVLARDSEANVCAAAVEVLAETGGPGLLPLLAQCAARFPDDPFLAFAIRVAGERLGAQR